MESANTDNVLLCFFLTEVFSTTDSELSPMMYKATLGDSSLDSSLSLRTDTGSQRWITRNKLIWSISRTTYDEVMSLNSMVLQVEVYQKRGDEMKTDTEMLCEFSLKLPSVADGINWDEIFQTEVGTYRFHFHYHVQPNYITNNEYKKQVQEGKILLLSPDSKLNESAADYELSMSLVGVEGWDTLVSLLEQNHYSSDSYTFNLTFTRSYQTIPKSSYSLDETILHLDSVRFHAPVHLLSLFFQTLEPPLIQLRGSKQQLICEFIPDFEELGFNLACCPDDKAILESTSSIQLQDTVQLKDMLDNEQRCPAIISDFICSTCFLNVHIALRKIAIVQKTEKRTEEPVRPLPVQVDILQRKLKNMEEYQAETVKHYEKELAAKQRIIHQLTQANREFEKLCIDSVRKESSVGEMVKLRNENEQLKQQVNELQERCDRLQKEKDELREVMVRVCTSEKLQ